MSIFPCDFVSHLIPKRLLWTPSRAGVRLTLQAATLLRSPQSLYLLLPTFLPDRTRETLLVFKIKVPLTVPDPGLPPVLRTPLSSITVNTDLPLFEARHSSTSFNFIHWGKWTPTLASGVSVPPPEPVEGHQVRVRGLTPRPRVPMVQRWGRRPGCTSCVLSVHSFPLGDRR